MRKSASVFMPSTAFRYTLPPSPPSPPSGPPKGTNFSRRKLTQPRPPLPACTLSLASSTNFIRPAPDAKLHTAGCHGKQRVIGANADIRAWTHARAALAHDDIAGQDLLTAEAL